MTSTLDLRLFHAFGVSGLVVGVLVYMIRDDMVGIELANIINRYMTEERRRKIEEQSRKCS